MPPRSPSRVTVDCIGSAADPVFAYMVRRMNQLGVECRVVDLVELLHGNIEINCTGVHEAYLTTSRHQSVINQASRCFLRLIDISRGAPDKELAARAEDALWMLRRFFSGLPAARIIGAPPLDMTNFSKVLHLHALRTIVARHGVKVPDTILTASPQKALQFINDAPGGVISKGASAVKTDASRVQQDDFSRLGAIAAVPALFQEEIVGTEVRVHVVGNEIFAEGIVSEAVDYRFDRTVPTIFVPVELPQSLRRCSIELSNHLRTGFCGIDFRISESGEVYFLEANGMPAFVGYDRRCNGAISLAVVDYLCA